MKLSGAFLMVGLSYLVLEIPFSSAAGSASDVNAPLARSNTSLRLPKRKVIESPSVSVFEELPPDLPLPSSPIQGLDWTRSAIIIQPWGYSQKEMMEGHDDKFASILRSKYGFNTLCVMPPTALAAVGGGRQNESDFTNSLTQFRKAGYKVILYSSLVNAGHDPSWYAALKNHPEWRQINPAGASATWLCPNSGAFEFNLNYTKAIVARYGADGVMLDNNFFASPDNNVGVSCYCDSCERKFKAYVLRRFGQRAEQILGVSCAQMKIPRAAGPLYNLWKIWRNRSLAEATENVRRNLPGLIVLANTQYWWWTMGEYGWALASDLQYPHEDMVLSESYASEAYGMPNQDSSGISTKLIMGRAIAGERPLCDLIGTFQWEPPKFEPLKSAAVLQRRLGVALMYLAQPWLGYYGMETPGAESDASRRALSELLRFRTDNEGLYEGLQQWGSVGSILPNGSYNCLGVQCPVVPPHVVTLRKRGFPTDGLYDLTLNLTDLAKHHVVVAENVVCLSEEKTSMLVKWIKSGGTLIATPDLAYRDEIGRQRASSKMAEIINVPDLKSKRLGRGRLIIERAGDLPKSVQAQVDETFTFQDIGDRKVELQPYASIAKDRLVLHIANHGADMAKPWTIVLPPSVSKAARQAVFHTPKGTAQILRIRDRLILPAMEAYAVIEIELAK